MESEAILYLSDCVDEVVLYGETKIDQKGVDYLIEAVNNLKWYETSMPEGLPKNVGRKAIPCLVVVAPPPSRPGRKPRVTVCQRQWNQWRERWEWSRGLRVIKWRELPDV